MNADFISRPAGRLLLAAAVAGSLSCDGGLDETNIVGPGGGQPTTPTPALPRRPVGILELTFHDITSSNISATVLLAATVADLERLRSTPGSVGNVVVVTLESVITSEFAHTPSDGVPSRFVRATLGLRNVRRDSALFDGARENLSLVAVRTSATVPNTPIRVFQRADGSAASEALAQQVTPTALTAVDGDGRLVTIASETLESLTDEQIRNTGQFTGASALLPYAFKVRAPTAAARPFDGLVTVAYRLPTAQIPAENPTTFSVLFLIVNDTNAPRR